MDCVINDDFLRFKAFVEALPETFSCTGETLYQGRNVVKSFNVEGTTLVVKRFKRPNIVQAVAYTFFKKSKAERAYLYARMIRERGFLTPREVAYIEIKRCGLLSDSYFVSTSCTLPPLSDVLRRADFNRDCATQLGQFVAALHEKGVLHGDLNLTNILYELTDEGTYRFWLIDTNRSVFKQPTHDDCIENLKRLTHDRPLMNYVMRRYADARGWNADETSAEVLKKVEDYERKRHRIGLIKKLFKRKKGPFKSKKVEK